MAALATSEDMISRYDARTLGKICSDAAEQVAEIDLASDPKMSAALSSATGLVKAAIQKSSLYTDADLSGLTGEGLALLVDCTCAVAWWLLWRRKPVGQDKETRGEARDEAMDILKKLRTGEYVLDVSANQQAGIPDIDTVSRVTINNEWGLVTDAARPGFYPRRTSYRNR